MIVAPGRICHWAMSVIWFQRGRMANDCRDAGKLSKRNRPRGSALILSKNLRPYSEAWAARTLTVSASNDWSHSTHLARLTPISFKYCDACLIPAYGLGRFRAAFWPFWQNTSVVLGTAGVLPNRPLALCHAVCPHLDPAARALSPCLSTHLPTGVRFIQLAAGMTILCTMGFNPSGSA